MSNLSTVPVTTPGAAHSPVRSIPAPRPDHVQALAEDIGMARLLLDAGDEVGAKAVLALTQQSLSNMAAAMVTR